MTPALLAAIKARLAAADDLLDRMGDLGFDQDDADTLDDMRADLPALVAEVERLRPLADNWATCLDVTREVHGSHGCIFCGYNGEGYWQRGTHDARCPWVNVGGEEDRAREFWATVRATWKRMIAADDRVSAVVADRDAANCRLTAALEGK